MEKISAAALSARTWPSDQPLFTFPEQIAIYQINCGHSFSVVKMCFQSPLGLRQMICIKWRAHCLVVLSIIPSTCKTREECGHPCHERGYPGMLRRAHLVMKHPPETLAPFTRWCVVPFVPGWQEVASYATKWGKNIFHNLALPCWADQRSVYCSLIIAMRKGVYTE